MTPGTVLSGKYKLVSLLGEGGMGAVWRAEDLRLGGAPVAIKVMHSRDAARPEIQARFEQEVRTAAKLRNPHVAQVYDVGVDDQSGAQYFAMELLEGESLEQRLERAGTLAPAEVARVVSHVAHGLSRAHELGIVHRDLKPANIFLVQNADGGLAKVLDFGVAKRSSQSLQHGRATATGMLLGTPHYMSPEQIRSSKDVDHRSDIWSLGVIATECLTGKVPFDSDNLPGLALLICQGHATVPSQLGPVPAGFDAWFQRATRLEREQRFASALLMAEELRTICGAAGAGAAGIAAPPRHPLEAPRETTHAQRSSPSVGPLSRTTPGSRLVTTTATDPLEQRARRLRKSALLAAAALALVLIVVTYSLLRPPGAQVASLPKVEPAPAASAALPARAPVDAPVKPSVEATTIEPDPPPRIAPIPSAPAPASTAPSTGPAAAARAAQAEAPERARRDSPASAAAPTAIAARKNSGAPRAATKPKTRPPKRTQLPATTTSASPAPSNTPPPEPAPKPTKPPAGLTPF